MAQVISLSGAYGVASAGLAGSITTFSSWMLEGYESFANLGGYQRSGLYDVGHIMHEYIAKAATDSVNRADRRRASL